MATSPDTVRFSVSQKDWDTSKAKNRLVGEIKKEINVTLKEQE